jgi:hypothetical protein
MKVSSVTSSNNIEIFRASIDPIEYGIWIDSAEQSLKIRLGKYTHDEPLKNGKICFTLPKESFEKETKIFAFSVPWEAPLSANEFVVGLNIAGTGWVNGVWHDGPIVVLNSDRRVEAYTPAGFSGSLTVPLSIPDKSSISIEEIYTAESHLTSTLCSSLELAISHKFPTTPVEVNLSSWEKIDLAALVLLVRAHGNTHIICNSSSDPKIKRLCQNLGIKQNIQEEGLPIKEISSLIAPQYLENVILELNSKTIILPETLLAIKR